ncbi:DNA-directed RNA polymerase subunit beta''-like [Ostrinia nubilalis]|uniref:DNA-directed RNA polymerase subunit beta''-like n=1 Tax=Ostrinia nubilalis TaxID=29057 RepID=UPI0030824927
MIGQEYLSKNILDKSLYETFSVLRILQVLFGSCRVDVRDRFVSSPTVYQKAYTLMIIVMSAFLYMINFVTYLYKYSVNINLYRSAIGTSLIQILMYFLNIIHVRFINNTQNVDFVISMQELDRSMKLEHNNSINTTLRRFNTITTILILSIWTVLNTIASIFLALPMMVTVVTISISEITNMLELNHCSNLMSYYTIRVRFINAILQNHLPSINKFNSNDYSYFYPKQFMRELAAKTHDLRYSATDIYLKKVIKNFFEFRNLYQFQVTTYWCTTYLLKNLSLLKY